MSALEAHPAATKHARASARRPADRRRAAALLAFATAKEQEAVRPRRRRRAAHPAARRGRRPRGARTRVDAARGDRGAADGRPARARAPARRSRVVARRPRHAGAGRRARRSWRRSPPRSTGCAGRLRGERSLEEERTQARLELAAAKQEASRLESLNIVAAGVAHEFNNRFQAIIGQDRAVARGRVRARPLGLRRHRGRRLAGGAARAHDARRLRATGSTCAGRSAVAELAATLPETEAGGCPGLARGRPRGRLTLLGDEPHVRQALGAVVANASEAYGDAQRRGGGRRSRCARFVTRSWRPSRTRPRSPASSSSSRRRPRRGDERRDDRAGVRPLLLDAVRRARPRSRDRARGRPRPPRRARSREHARAGARPCGSSSPQRRAARLRPASARGRAAAGRPPSASRRCTACR